MATKKKRPRRSCEWPSGDPLMIAYHDREWGVPLHEDRKIFEFLVLESMQAGLSWRTVLYKRENFRKAFSGFDPRRVARYTARDVTRLMNDAGIIRNRQKIEAAVNNARRFLEVQKEFGDFDHYIWSFVGGKPIRNRFRRLSELPARTELSDAIAKELKTRGFKFLGSTVVYAHMQATGMVNDHLVHCFRYEEVQAKRKGKARA